MVFDGGLLNARHTSDILSGHIFFLNLGGGDLSCFWRVGAQLWGVFSQVKEGVQEIVNLQPCI